MYNLVTASLKAEICSCFSVLYIYRSCSSFLSPSVRPKSSQKMPTIIHANSLTAIRHKTFRTGTNDLFLPCSHKTPLKNGLFMRKDQGRYSELQ